MKYNEHILYNSLYILYTYQLFFCKKHTAVEARPSLFPNSRGPSALPSPHALPRRHRGSHGWGWHFKARVDPANCGSELGLLRPTHLCHRIYGQTQMETFKKIVAGPWKSWWWQFMVFGWLLLMLKQEWQFMIQDRLQFPERKAIAIHCHPELPSKFIFLFLKSFTKNPFQQKNHAQRGLQHS